VHVVIRKTEFSILPFLKLILLAFGDPLCQHLSLQISSALAVFSVP